MLGLNVKRGVATTLERIFNDSGNKFGKLDILWSGTTAGIIFNRNGNDNSCINAKVIFPCVDESADIPQPTFNNLIGYALHELGHAWYTTNRPWDDARKKYGAYVGNLINGLEDPRIERKVIESGHAPNSRVLFENLINSVLGRDGYVDPNDAKNIPFLLAVEGRRLNGYAITVPNIIDQSAYAKHLHWALGRASKAVDTSAIVKIAVELFKRIKDQDEDAGKDQEQGEGQPSDEDQQGEQGEQGGDQGDQQDGQPTDQQDGQPSDEQGDPSDKPSDDPSQGGGKSYDGGREVEPNNFIRDELKQHRPRADEGRPIPTVGKAIYVDFSWR
jgi:hypothetical protein